MKRWLVLAGLGALALAVSFTAGRYSRPAEVREVERVVERVVTRLVYLEKEERRRAVRADRVVETRTPDGSIVTRFEGYRLGEELRLETRSETSQEAAREAQRERVEVQAAPRWHAALRASWALPEGIPGPPAWGVSLDYRLLGPLWVGVEAGLPGPSSPASLGARFAVSF